MDLLPLASLFQLGPLSLDRAIGRSALLFQPCAASVVGMGDTAVQLSACDEWVGKLVMALELSESEGFMSCPSGKDHRSLLPLLRALVRFSRKPDVSWELLPGNFYA